VGCVDTAGTGGVGGREGMKKVGELLTKAMNMRWPGEEKDKQIKKEKRLERTGRGRGTG